MTYGPIELLVIEFPGNEFTGEIAPALAELVDTGMVRIIDILFVYKSDESEVTETELADLDESLYTQYEALVFDTAGLLTHEDAILLTESMEPNSSAGLVLFENVWATRFATAVRNANGQVILNERIPHAAIEALLDGQTITEG
jgi:hypothetical protein